MALDTARRPQQALQLRAAFAPATYDASTRSVELTWSTGADVPRSSWSGDFVERLSLAPGAVRLDRLNTGAPLLDAHNSMELRNVIGVVERAWLTGNQGHAVVRFSDRPEVEPIVQDVKNGILRNISVGYKVHRWETTPPSDSVGVEIRTAVDWEPYELSLVPIPADAGAQVRSDNITQGDIVNNQTITTDNTDHQTRAEQQRVEGIRDAARRFEVSEDFARKLIEQGVSLDEARGQLIDARSAEERRTPGIARVDVTEYGQRQGAPAEMLQRGLGECISGKSPRHAVRVLEDFLIASGRMSRVENLSPKEIVSRAWATSDFPIALQGLGQREVLSAYQSTQNGLIAAATRNNTLRDFRPVKGLRFSQLGALQGKKEGGEYKATGFSEEAAYELIAKEWGALIPITRNVPINDDLGMVGRLLQEAGRAGAETDRELLASALDSISWGATNSTTSAMGIEALGAGVLLLRRQHDAENRAVSFEPDLIVAAPEHELELRQLLGDYQPASAGEVQPFSNLRLEIDHRLSEGAFYMVDSRYAPLMIGSIGDPVVSTQEDFRTGNLMLRVQHDAAACVVDTRSIAKVTISA